jgi:hypothetical protein
MIGETRKAILTKAVGTLKDPIDKIMAGEEGKPDYCMCLDTSMRTPCESMMLGSAIVNLTRAGMWPLPDSTKYNESPAKLCQALDAVEASRFKESKVLPHLDHHTLCGLGHHKALEGLLDFGKTTALISGEALDQLTQHGTECGSLSEEFVNAIQSDGSDKEVRPWSIASALGLNVHAKTYEQGNHHSRLFTIRTLQDAGNASRSSSVSVKAEAEGDVNGSE